MDQMLFHLITIPDASGSECTRDELHGYSVGFYMDFLCGILLGPRLSRQDFLYRASKDD